LCEIDENSTADETQNWY